MTLLAWICDRIIAAMFAIDNALADLGDADD